MSVFSIILCQKVVLNCSHKKSKRRRGSKSSAIVKVNFFLTVNEFSKWIVGEIHYIGIHSHSNQENPHMGQKLVNTRPKARDVRQKIVQFKDRSSDRSPSLSSSPGIAKN
ncbi:hypothetical protein Hanom_Chr02g00109971 [Helianthus anomalus]